MLKKLVITTLILISSLSYAKLDSEFLSNELFKITNYNLKNNIYTLHIAAEDFSNMTPSEYNLNLKNIEKLINSKSIINEFTLDEISYIENTYKNTIESIYKDTNPKINAARTLNFPVKNYFFTMISIPNFYYENYNNCEGVFILFDSYVCFEVDDSTKSFISKYLKRNHIPSLSSEFMGNFTIIHEYSHLLPEQLRINPTIFFNSINNKIKKDIKLIYHYNEVYSDLYAAIRLLQKGHKREELDQIIFMRDLSLFLYKDTVHYSSPYIKSLKNLDPENYMLITSFKEFENLINKIFFDVINRIDTTSDKSFYAEKLESKKSLEDISKFIISINNNVYNKTFKIKSQEDVDFITLLFNGFSRNVYYANRRFEIQYKEN